jgi:hypothetical protein
MDAIPFDQLTRGLSTIRTRRGILAGLVATFGLAAPPNPAVTKSKKKPLKRNEFGCVNVGGKCRGKDANCCSGICQGKKPKKGEKDKSRCIAHDEWGCVAGFHVCADGPFAECLIAGKEDGLCGTTTGNAGYCGNSFSNISCQRDADCRTRCGPDAACVLCAASESGRICAGTGDCLFPA